MSPARLLDQSSKGLRPTSLRSDEPAQSNPSVSYDRTMTVRVPVEGALLAWAQRRSRVSRDTFLAKFPALDAWEAGEKQPTLRQLEQFARATYTAFHGEVRCQGVSRRSPQWVPWRSRPCAWGSLAMSPGGRVRWRWVW